MKNTSYIIVILMAALCLIGCSGKNPEIFWKNAVADGDLPSLAETMKDPSSPRWPTIISQEGALKLSDKEKLRQAQYRELAKGLFDRIKGFEGMTSEVPTEELPEKINIYASLSSQLRAAGGYSNYVLADTLNCVALYYIGQFIYADPGSWKESETLIQSLKMPMFSADSFEEFLKEMSEIPKNGIDLEGIPENQLVGKIAELCGAEFGWGLIPTDHYKLKTSSMLAGLNIGGLLSRTIQTDLMAAGLAEYIEYLKRGGTPELLDNKDARIVRRAYSEIMGDRSRKISYPPIPIKFDGSAISHLLENLRDQQRESFIELVLDGPLRQESSDKGIKVTLKETSLGKLFKSKWYKPIPDFRNVVWFQNINGKVHISIDGLEGKPYDLIYYLTFSPDGNNLAYAADDGSEKLIVVNDQPGKPYNNITSFGVKFSPDNQAIAYTVREGNKAFVVINGKEGKRYQGVFGLTFTPDSQSIAFMACRRNKWVLVHRGKEGTREYDRVNSGITFSPDGKWWIHGVKKGKKEYIILDGPEYREFEGRLAKEPSNTPLFSQDSKRLVFTTPAKKDHPAKYWVHIVDLDTLEETIFDAWEYIRISPDCSSVASVRKREKRAYSVVINNKEYAHPGSVGAVVFSPNGKRWAYRVSSAPSRKGSVLFGSDFKSKEYRKIKDIIFSPDSKKVSFVSGTNDYEFIVSDGKEGPHHRYVRHLAYSPDSKHLVYATHVSHVITRISVDGVESDKDYDQLPYSAKIVFDGPKKFHTLALRNDEVFLVEGEIVDGLAVDKNLSRKDIELPESEECAPFTKKYIYDTVKKPPKIRLLPLTEVKALKKQIHDQNVAMLKAAVWTGPSPATSPSESKSNFPKISGSLFSDNPTPRGKPMTWVYEKDKSPPKAKRHGNSIKTPRIEEVGQTPADGKTEKMFRPENFLEVQGIMTVSGEVIAFIDGEMVKVGDKIKGAEVLGISSEEVRLKYNGTLHIVKLGERIGNSGETIHNSAP